jgi:hypothetical protein
MREIKSAMANIGWFGDFEYQWSDLEAKAFCHYPNEKIYLN